MNNIQLLEKYNPILVLDKGEQYYPGSAIDYIKMSYFHFKTGIISSTNDKDKTFDNFKKLAAHGKLENGKGTSIIIKDEYKNIHKILDKKNNKDKKIINPPVYCHVLEKGDRKQLFYIFFYNFNGPKHVLNLFPTGDHLADIEMIIIELKNNEPEKVFLSQHVSGEWRNFENMYRIGDRIIVFSAINSHAHYAEPGKYIRFLGFGNDNCSKGVNVYAKIEYINKGNPLFDYKGFFGKKINSFNSRFFWHEK